MRKLKLIRKCPRRQTPRFLLNKKSNAATNSKSLSSFVDNWTQNKKRRLQNVIKILRLNKKTQNTVNSTTTTKFRTAAPQFWTTTPKHSTENQKQSTETTTEIFQHNPLLNQAPIFIYQPNTQQIFSPQPTFALTKKSTLHTPSRNRSMTSNPVQFFILNWNNTWSISQEAINKKSGSSLELNESEWKRWPESVYSTNSTSHKTK